MIVQETNVQMIAWWILFHKDSARALLRAHIMNKHITITMEQITFLPRKQDAILIDNLFSTI
jgi:hypothetical protein